MSFDFSETESEEDAIVIKVNISRKGKYKDYPIEIIIDKKEDSLEN